MEQINQKSNEEAVRENTRKKAYLHSYRPHVRRISRIESEIEELRAMKMGSAVNNDGMPHGHNQSDLSGYAANIDELERRLAAEKNQRIAAYDDITERIEHLENENEKDVLFYRYIKGMEWWEIAEKMKFSERQIFRIHGKGLAHLSIPEEDLKDVSECQSNM